MITLPIVETITIPGLDYRLIDTRRITPEAHQRAKAIMVEVLEGFLQRERPDVELCRMQQSEHENAAYARALERDPNLAFSHWEENLATDDDLVRDDADCDPRLTQINFVVRDAQGTRGLFNLYNVRVERDDARGIVASAMAMPGCFPAEGSTLRATWSAIMRWILENDFRVGGRTVDFIEWRFPQRRNQRWTMSEAEAVQVGVDNTPAAVPSRGIKVADLDGHDFVEDENGVPIRTRRPPRSR